MADHEVEADAAGGGILARVVRHIEARPLATVLGAVVLTLLLIVPAVALPPEGTASGDPAGEVFDTQEMVDDRFESSLYVPPYVVEARSGDVLTREPLLELFINGQALRESALQDSLTSIFSADSGVVLQNIFSIADTIDLQLRVDGVAGGLAAASEDEVKIAASHALSEGSPFDWQRDLLSARRTVERRTVGGEEIDYWVTPASQLVVFADNDALGGGGSTVVLGSDDTTKEQFARDVLALLQGDQESYRLWGIAIDVNLTSDEQGATAGPFIMFTIIAVLLVVGVVMRSYWAVAVVGAALAALMVWLKGVSNLIGLESSLILDFIVPIAMISFGVDFAFHAVGRYREQRLAGHTPRPALVTGLAGVLGALLLAFMSDSVAFLSNVISGIPQVIQFGIGATVALFAAFVALGIIVPTALALIEERLGVGHGLGRGGIAGVILASVVAGVAVLLLIVLPPVGAAALVAYGLLLLAVPLWLAMRRRDAEEVWEEITHDGGERSRFSLFTGDVVLALTRWRYVLLPVVAVVTIVSGVFATRVEAAFDVKDFFSSKSDFVIALDKIDEHFGETGGEPATIYIEGELDTPEALAAVERFVASVDALGSPRFARSVEGELGTSPLLPDMVREALAESVAVAAIEQAQGIELTDEDHDGLPDTPAQIAAVFAYASAAGVPYDEQHLRYSTDDVGLLLWTSEDGDRRATQITFFLPGTRNVENVGIALDELTPITEQLEAELGGGAFVSLTGGPFTRQESLNATFRALQRSVPIAVVLCLVLTAVFMRSLRLALVSTVPIVLVVAWLYAFMYAFGFGLNLVTATIGAVSVGVGIDYAIHFTMRFREEHQGEIDRFEAVRRTAVSTGNALLGSAASSIIGFAIMAFAPMPLFAAYGLLTAVMIVFAAAAALVVLPPLLVLVTSEPKRERAG
jgi:predicted RND superfamily exporter protein